MHISAITRASACASTPAGIITVLRVRSSEYDRATKTARLTPKWGWVKQDQKFAYDFNPREEVVENIDQLAAVIGREREIGRGVLVAGRLSAAVRDKLADIPALMIRRTKETIEDVPRSWVCVDVDNLPLEAADDLVNAPEAVLRRVVRDLLPEAFQNVRCFWQLSARAGLVQVIKTHIFFWLAQPVSNDDLKLTMQQHAPLLGDYSIYNPYQVIYIQDPILWNGEDPLPRRTGWLDGEQDAVALPAPIPLTVQEKNRIKRVGAAKASAGHGVGIGFPGDPWQRLGDGLDRNGFHLPTRTIVMRYAVACAAGDQQRDDEALKEKLRDAIVAAPRGTGRLESEIIGYGGDDYLDRSIRGAFQRVQWDQPAAIEPEYELPENSVDEAREQVTRFIKGFLGWTKHHHKARANGKGGWFNGVDWHEFKPPRRACASTTGIGKSSILRSLLPDFIGRMQTAELPWRCLITIPEHALGAEALAAMQAAGLNAASWRGRSAPDPNAPKNHPAAPPVTMCRNLDAVQDALAVGADVENAVCRECPLRAGCAYQEQKTVVAQADVAVAAHNILFGALPSCISKDLALVVADESFLPAALYPPRQIAMAGLADAVAAQPVLTGDGVADAAATQELIDICRRLETACAGHAAGEFLRKAALEAAGLTAEMCETAGKLEWRRKVDVLRPGMNAEERRRAVEKGSGNRCLGRRARMWNALWNLLVLSEGARGELRVDVVEDELGARRVLTLFGRRELGRSVSRLPFLHLDATLDEAILGRFLPGLKVCRIDARADHARVVQVKGRFGMGALGARKGDEPTELAHKLRDFVAVRAAGEPALVITYKAVEHVFAGLPGVSVLHHGRVAGIDEFKSVRRLFVIGRPMQRDEDALIMAQSIFSEAPIEPEGSVMLDGGVLMRDGAGKPMPVRRYADPRLEAVRRQVTDAAAIQEVGRGRAVNRSADIPLDIYVLADVILPMPVDEMVAWGDIQPNILEVMLAQHGCATLSATDACKLHPDLFPDGLRAAQFALNQVPAGWRPGGTRLIEYRPKGRGQRTRTAWVQHGREDEAKDWLADHLGPLGIWNPV
jgi:hypothetical protein